MKEEEQKREIKIKTNKAAKTIKQVTYLEHTNAIGIVRKESKETHLLVGPNKQRSAHQVSNSIHMTSTSPT